MFTKKDFSETLVNPLDEGKLLDNGIFKHKDFKLKIGLIPTEIALKYLVSVYDKKSPFRKKFDDIIKRKTEAALFAGFKFNEFNEFEEKYYELLMCENENFNKMIIRYCRIHHSADYSYLVTFEDLYFKQLESIRMDKNIDPKKVKQVKDEISAIMDKILADDRSMQLQSDLLKVINDDNLDIYPENLAEKIHKGEKPLGNFIGR